MLLLAERSKFNGTLVFLRGLGDFVYEAEKNLSPKSAVEYGAGTHPEDLLDEPAKAPCKSTTRCDGDDKLLGKKPIAKSHRQKL